MTSRASAHSRENGATSRVCGRGALSASASRTDIIDVLRTICGSSIVVSLASLLIAAPPAVRATPLPQSCAEGSSLAASAETIRVDGRERSYLIHAARGVDGKPPLVLAFHGRGETPELLERYSNLSALAATVVYPRGLPGRGGKLSWSGTPTAAAGVDDVRFARAIVARLVRAGCVDAARVYATGKSDGGGLAVDLACEAADLVAAVAPVSGAYYPISGGCKPARPVSVLEFHGTADPVVPYAGSAERGLPDIATWLADWAARDSCSEAEPSRTVADGVTVREWLSCRGHSVVRGYRISGGGHTWPGAKSPSGPGKTTQAIGATSTIARFFGIATRLSFCAGSAR